MIRSKNDLKEYIAADARANGRTNVRPTIWGDEVWKFIVNLRKLEFYTNMTGITRKIMLPARVFHKINLHNRALKLGFSIPINVFGKGLAIVHYGTIVVAKGAKIGQNCRIHEGVTIGATNGSEKAPVLGNNVFLGTGAKVLGDIVIADDVAIAANAVVSKSILEKGTTWGGVPAKKISDNDSHSNLCNAIFER